MGCRTKSQSYPLPLAGGELIVLLMLFRRIDLRIKPAYHQVGEHQHHPDHAEEKREGDRGQRADAFDASFFITAASTAAAAMKA